MKKYIFLVIGAFFVMYFNFIFGKYFGRNDAYADFSSDKCWVKIDTRDVVCIQKIKD